MNPDICNKNACGYESLSPINKIHAEWPPAKVADDDRVQPRCYFSYLDCDHTGPGTELYHPFALDVHVLAKIIS